MDWCSPEPHGTKRSSEASKDGRRIENPGHWPRRSGDCHQQGTSTLESRFEGPAATNWIVYLLGTNGSRKDVPGAFVGRIYVRRLRCPDPDRHVRVHGEIYGFQADWLASGLCRLRRRWSAIRGGSPPA